MGISRRHFFALAGGALGAAAGAGTLDAFVVEPEHVPLTRHDVPVPGLHPSLDGLRIAQVTDVHFPGNMAAAEAVLAHLRRERPEVVVLTGDMTERAAALPQVAAFARAARGAVATVATLGNWEYYSGAAPGAPSAYRGAGVELLVNAHRAITLGGGGLALVGLDDPVNGRPNLVAARAGLAPHLPEVWLVHAPGVLGHRFRHVDPAPALVLAGHTHGGQIRLPLLPAFTPVGSGRFVAGWYRDTPGPLYVSRGVGTTMIHARFRCPPELPLFTLRAA